MSDGGRERERERERESERERERERERVRESGRYRDQIYFNLNPGLTTTVGTPRHRGKIWHLLTVPS